MHDIVVTTYWELFQSLPHPDKKTIKEWEKDSTINIFQAYLQWAEDREDENGLLQEITWYRVSC